MESAFEIIAEPNRRAILSLPASSEQSVGEIDRQLGTTQPTVSIHLRVSGWPALPSHSSIRNAGCTPSARSH